MSIIISSLTLQPLLLKICYQLKAFMSLLDINRSLLNYTVSKPNLYRKLSLVNDFFMTLRKLRLGLLQQDRTFRFSISARKVSQIFISWIKMLSK